MTNFNYDVMSTEELGNLYSDYSKDVNGFRDRSVNYNDRSALIAAIEGLDRHMELMKSTFAGREQLREDGWNIPETDPELIQQAKWLQEERDRFHAELFDR